MINDRKVFRYDTGGYIRFVVYTNWFPANVKPVHPGWYVADRYPYEPDNYTESDYMWYWDGKSWTDRLDESNCSYYADLHQNRRWRGLCANVQEL